MGKPVSVVIRNVSQLLKVSQLGKIKETSANYSLCFNVHSLGKQRKDWLSLRCVTSFSILMVLKL